MPAYIVQFFAEREDDTDRRCSVLLCRASDSKAASEGILRTVQPPADDQKWIAHTAVSEMYAEDLQPLIDGATPDESPLSPGAFILAGLEPSARPGDPDMIRMWLVADSLQDAIRTAQHNRPGLYGVGGIKLTREALTEMQRDARPAPPPPPVANDG